MQTPTGLTVYVQIASILGTAVALGSLFVTRTWPWLRAILDSRLLRSGAGSYSLQDIQRSVKYYVHPYCQRIDPSAGEPAVADGHQQKLFDALDDALSHPTDYRYLILLADSGMGKTSAMLNYYVRHRRRWGRRPTLVLIPLGITDSDEKIAAIPNKEDSIIFLDALDEDILALVDCGERLRILLNATRDFRRVIISCRTQFFSKDEEIPTGTAILKVGSRPAGESAEHIFHKIYLCPFTDQQVIAYLRKCYPLWQWQSRRKGQQMVKRIPDLAVRPMLLAHIDDLLKSGKEFHEKYELYEEMVEAWLQREEGFVQGKDNLRQFSEILAKDLFLNKEERGAERVPKAALRELANYWKISLDDWKLTGRSLLNRDADGNYKFAHRSFLEYLFVKRFFDGDRECLGVEWTDQMEEFLWEMLEKQASTTQKLPFHNAGSPLYKMVPGAAGSKLLTSAAAKHLKGPNLLSSVLSVALDPEGIGDVNAVLLKCLTKPLRTMVSITQVWRVTLKAIDAFPKPRFLPDSQPRDMVVPSSTILVSSLDISPQSRDAMYDLTVKILSAVNPYLGRQFLDPSAREPYGSALLAPDLDRELFLISEHRSALIAPIYSSEKLVGLFVCDAPRRDAFLESQVEEVQRVLAVAGPQL
jgi:hypothetical protein